LSVEDIRALNVLFHSHLNPYGLFLLGLSTRLGIALPDPKVFDDYQAVLTVAEAR